MATTDKPTTDKPTTPPESDSVDVDALNGDDKTAKKEEKDPKPNIALPVIIGSAALVAAGITWAVTTWGWGVAIFVAVLLGFAVFAIIGWHVKWTSKRKTRKTSSSGSSGGSRNHAGGFPGFGKDGSRNRKPGSKNRKGGSKDGSRNRPSGSGAGSGNHKGSSKDGSRKPSGGSRNQNHGSRNRKPGSPQAAKTPGLNRSTKPPTGSRNQNRQNQNRKPRGAGSMFSPPTKAEFADDWKAIKKAAKRARKGGSLAWEGAYRSGGYAADASTWTKNAFADAFKSIAPVKTDRTDDAQPDDDKRTVNDDAELSANTQGGNQQMRQDTFNMLGEEVRQASDKFDLTSDASLYGFIGDTPEFMENVAAAFKRMAERANDENSKGTQEACDGLLELGQHLDQVAAAGHQIRAWVYRTPDYLDYMKRLDDPNGTASDVNTARQAGY